MNHILHRSIDDARYSVRPDYERATLKKRFPDKIGALLNRYIQKLEVAVLTIEFGRTEFEEYPGVLNYLSEIDFEGFLCWQGAVKSNSH